MNSTYVPPVLGSIMKAVVCTPNRNHDAKEYEEGVIKPATEIRKLWDELEDQRPSDDQIRQAIRSLLTIFQTKGVDLEERNDRLKEIIELHGLQELFPDLLPLRLGLEETRSLPAANQLAPSANLQSH